jgi:hypothetical protein
VELASDVGRNGGDGRTRGVLFLSSPRFQLHFRLMSRSNYATLVRSATLNVWVDPTIRFCGAVSADRLVLASQGRLSVGFHQYVYPSCDAKT